MTGTLQIPELYCPFAGSISPFADAIEADNLAWLAQHGFAPDGAAAARLRAAGFGRLAARGFPDASLERLRLAAAWLGWLFMRDDRCDEESLGSVPAAARALSLQHLSVLAGQAHPEGPDSLARALSDLRQQTIAIASPAWMARFLSHAADYLEATTWEAENRWRGSVPELATYVRLRDFTGVIGLCFDLHELVAGPTLALEARSYPALARMKQLANRAICWANDIFSLEKEQRHGDCHNLVIVLAHHRQLDTSQALLRASHLHDQAVRSFEALEASFVRSGFSEDALCVVAALKSWMRANIDWSRETGRYAT